MLLRSGVHACCLPACPNALLSSPAVCVITTVWGCRFHSVKVSAAMSCGADQMVCSPHNFLRHVWQSVRGMRSCCFLWPCVVCLCVVCQSVILVGALIGLLLVSQLCRTGAWAARVGFCPQQCVACSRVSHSLNFVLELVSLHSCGQEPLWEAGFPLQVRPRPFPALFLSSDPASTVRSRQASCFVRASSRLCVAVGLTQPELRVCFSQPEFCVGFTQPEPWFLICCPACCGREHCADVRPFSCSVSTAGKPLPWCAEHHAWLR